MNSWFVNKYLLVLTWVEDGGEKIQQWEDYQRTKVFPEKYCGISNLRSKILENQGATVGEAVIRETLARSKSFARSLTLLGWQSPSLTRGVESRLELCETSLQIVHRSLRS